ncbi:recombinase family protein [Intestinimonas massiliensis]|uniref:Recombinase family protein n=1 Tax=Intestinimonas massiliensis (ex Afouda et al. 2020) TaxID=1673721 RepID=A0AAW5JN79_9FIRM|nr:recombinase family protein [Intestinimonas massiliensis (ex Afouda et al. 2020)]MCQ4770325.1 recombinase family protein [Intestinimonas massiliensis (ex Afouda et al. 2020)]
MAQVKLISPISRQTYERTKVAAYCRVSSNSADQLNSYAAQIKAYTKLIKSNEAWELIEIFADEGLSGMKAENRVEFQRMIEMCERKQIDLIITKSVSRFARNVKEALEYVRKLKLLGIGVQFEKEGIYTLALGDEMLLNTFTAIAQEESKAISQNQRLSIVKRMERGEYVDSNAPYGFRLQDKKLEAFDQEADVVRYIFQQYLSGWSTSEIARDLTEKGIQTKLGKEQWRSTKISYILSNERYVGDCKYQKTCRDTTVPFKQSKNRGQEDMFYASDTHDPIIDRESFERVQALLQDRKERFSKSEQQNIYPLTSRIRCFECGSFYRRKVRNGAIKWVCAKHSIDTHTCPSGYYSEERIYDGFITMVNKLRFGEERILDQVIAKLETTAALYKRNNTSAGKMSQSIAELNAKLVMLEQLRSKGYLATEVYQSQARDIQKQISNLKSERRCAFGSKITTMLDEVVKMRSLLNEIEEPLEEFDDKLFYELVKGIEINKQDEMTVIFLGGLKFTELI